MQNRILPLAIIVLLVGADPLIAAINVNLKLDKFTPHIGDSLKQKYKGAHIFLADFTNNAENTGLWNYYSKNPAISYKTSHNLNSFLWYCFEKALTEMGMFFYKEAPSVPGIATLELEFSSWTHEGFTGRITLYKSGVIKYQKIRQLKFQPAESLDPTHLETRAYDCVNTIIASILEDKEFQASFFERQSGRNARE